MIPLNQTYRREQTLEEHSLVRFHLRSYEAWAKAKGLGRGGRSYDFAIALASVDFDGKDVLELGARDSYFGSYLTDRANVVVSDGFIGFHGSGDFDDWSGRWTGAAKDPDRIIPATIDMRATKFPDACFDIVVNTSCVEHLRGDDDIASVQEMARICRPGGYLVIGTDMAATDRRHGGRYYSEQAVYSRLIDPTGCHVHGRIDLSWDGCDQSMHKSGAFMRSWCIFVLRKPDAD